MADERLRLRIEADAKRAERDLKNLTKLSEELTDDQKTILVQAKTQAAEKNLKSLERQLGKVEDPVDMRVLTKGIEQARDELEQLNRLADKADAQSIDIDTTKSVEGIDDLGNSADKSKSVLANMVGNATQDLGALGGVAGSAGVAIGQMGEYMADAAAGGSSFTAILKNFGTIAGPIAGISVGIALATKAWGDYQAKQKAIQKENEDALARIREQLGMVEELQKVLSRGEGFSIAETLLGDADPDEMTKMAEGLVAFGTDLDGLLDALEKSGGTTAKFFADMARSTNAVADLRKEFGFSTREMGEAVATSDDLVEATDALAGSNVELRAALISDEGWAAFVRNAEMIEDAFDEIKLGDRARDAVNEMVAGFSGPRMQQAALKFRKAFGDDNVKVLQAIGDEMKTVAAETNAAALRQDFYTDKMNLANAEFQQGRQVAQAYADAINDIDYNPQAIQAGADAQADFTDKFFVTGNLIQAQTDAWEGYKETLKGVGHNLDTTTEKGAKQHDALEELASVVDQDLAKAYKDAGGNSDKFKTSASQLADTMRTKLRKETDLSDESIEEIIAHLGLLDTDVETRYQLSGDEEAKVKLGLLSTAIAKLDEPVTAEINQKIIMGDYMGALALAEQAMQREADKNPIRQPIEFHVRGTTRNQFVTGGVVPQSMPQSVPPDDGITPTALVPLPVTTAAVMPAFTLPTISVGVDVALARRQMRSMTRELERMAGLTRTVHGAHSRYLWRNGRYLETNAV